MGAAATIKGEEPLVRVRGFEKRYRRRVVVQGVDLEIHRGELYGLIGADGAGKSSVMKAVAGVLSFEAGEVEVFGVKINSERAAERVKSRLGFMPQGLGQNLYPELSVEENIDFFAHLRLVADKDLAERKRRLLSMTRLEQFRERPMKHLSGGMKQKLGLVCTLIHEPELLILDEPTTGVDPVSRRDFWAILTELLRGRGLTALISTAYMEEASRFHRISLLFAGRVAAHGEPNALVEQTHGALISLQATPQTEALARLTTRFSQVEALGPQLRVFVQEADAEEASQQIKSDLVDLHVHDLQVVAPNLEDIFVALLRRQKLVDDGTQDKALPPPVKRDRSAADIAIEATELVREFADFRAVDRVSFRVRQGEIFGLLGANGAGKTTVIKMLTGILLPTAGEGRVAGAAIQRAGQAIKEHIGYMSQAFSLYLDLTVVENIRLFAGIYGLSRRETRERLDWILSMAGLIGYESTLAGHLPLGVRQRLALGCALVHRPRVLFLDEPTSGVDPLGRRRFWRILLRLSREEDVAMLVTTHYMSEAEHCDHLALMYAGRIVADASPDVMKRQVEPEAGVPLELVADPPLRALELLERAGFSDVALFGNCLHLLSPNPDADQPRIRHVIEAGGAFVRKLAPRSFSLEDVFVHRIRTLEKQAFARSANP